MADSRSKITNVCLSFVSISIRDFKNKCEVVIMLTVQQTLGQFLTIMLSRTKMGWSTSRRCLMANTRE